MCDQCLKWGKKEKAEVVSRILKLSDEQIWKLFQKVGIQFNNEDKDYVLGEVRECEEVPSMHMDILLSEARSKEDLLKQLSILEKFRK